MGENIAIILGLAVIAWILVGPFVAIVLAQRARREARLLRRDLDAMRQLGVAPPPEAKPEPAPKPSPVAAPEPALPPPPIAAEPPSPPPAKPAPKPIKEAFASRGLVWLGGITLLLGGVFFSKFLIEYGYLPPALRIALGCLAGAALIGGGEWLRQKPLKQAVGSVQPNLIPPAISSAGIATIYGSLYSAYALHGLIGPTVAFVLLGAVSVLGIALAFRQGPMMAILGLLGGYGLPFLIVTAQPSIWGLLGYLTLITTAALAVARSRPWFWLPWSALGGSMMWAVLCFQTQPAATVIVPLAGYLSVVGGLFYAFRHIHQSGTEAPADPAWNLTALSSTGLAWMVAGTVVGLFAAALVRADQHAIDTLVWGGLVVAALLVAARREPQFEPLAAIAVLAALGFLVSWPPMIWVDPLDPAPSPRLRFAAAAVATAGIFAVGGFLMHVRAARPWLWASLSGGIPVIVLILAYWRLAAFEVDIAWGAISLVGATASLLAANLVARRRQAAGGQATLAAYAVAVVAFSCLGASMILRDFWLTAALAAHLPALAWIERRLQVPGLRWVAGITAVIVLVRLLVNPNLMPFGPVDSLVSNWIVYGYGLPALAFWVAAKVFRQGGADRTVDILDTGVTALMAALIGLEVRAFANDGDINASAVGLLELSLDAALYLALALYHHRRPASASALVAKIRVFGLAGLGLGLVAINASLGSPLIDEIPVGELPIVNLLLLAYGVPALVMVAFVLSRRPADSDTAIKWAAIAAGALLFINLSLEIRHLFQGPIIAMGPVGETELYAYSAAWLVFAIAVLGLGIVRRSIGLRQAGLGLLALVIFKVFVVDLAGLEGLLRALSFLGLGAGLIATGYLYQRFVQPPASE